MARLAFAIALVAFVLTGCGGDDEPAATGAVVQTVDVSLVDFALEPANPEIAQAGTVRFNATNNGQAPHSIEIHAPGGEAELESELAAGDSGSLEVDLSEPGTYEWYCPVGDHRERGMRGEITVAGGGEATMTETETQTTTTETTTTTTETETTETQTETSETPTTEDEGSGGGY